MRCLILLILWPVLPACMLPERAEREDVVDLSALAQYAESDDGSSYGLNLLAGLFQTDVHSEGSHTHFFPFYFRTAGPGEESFLLVLPFYYQLRRPFKEHTFVLLSGVEQRGFRTIYHPLFPLINFSFPGEDPRWGVFVFPLLDLQKDGEKGALSILDVLGLVKLYGRTWGYPPEPGGAGKRGSFALANALNLVQLAGGSDVGAYENFQVLTLFGSERISLFQRHWRRDGADGRTVFFPLYWHLRDEGGEVYHFWPIFSTASGPGWSRQGILSNMFTIRNDGGRKTLRLFWLIPIRWGDENESSTETR